MIPTWIFILQSKEFALCWDLHSVCCTIIWHLPPLATSSQSSLLHRSQDRWNGATRHSRQASGIELKQKSPNNSHQTRPHTSHVLLQCVSELLKIIFFHVFWYTGNWPNHSIITEYIKSLINMPGLIWVLHRCRMSTWRWILNVFISCQIGLNQWHLFLTILWSPNLT